MRASKKLTPLTPKWTGNNPPEIPMTVNQMVQDVVRRGSSGSLPILAAMSTNVGSVCTAGGR